MSEPARGDKAQRGYRRVDAQAWSADPPVEDTAPPERDGVTIESWGRTLAEARTMLAARMCPVCGEGPWRSPLNHAARKHGIRRWDMRNICGLTVDESVCDPDLSARFSERGEALMSPEKAREMAKRRAALGRERRWTKAGRENVAANLATWEAENPEAAQANRLRNATNPEAHAKQAESLRRHYAAKKGGAP